MTAAPSSASVAPSGRPLCDECRDPAQRGLLLGEELEYCELALVPQAQWCPVSNRQCLAVYVIGENGLRMVGAIKIDALVVLIPGKVHCVRRNRTSRSVP